MRFLNLQAPLRTNDHFRNRVNVEHHKGYSPLERIKNVDMIYHFSLDYMHSVCLGVMRKFLFLWRDDSRLYRINVTEFDKHIKSIKNWPEEFKKT